MNVPSQTLYVGNLNHKTKKNELQRALHLCFSAHGTVLDVVCVKSAALRGQAWVVFADVPSATSALRALQGFNFYDRPMRLAFAVSKSDAVAKLDGSWLPPHKRAKGPQPDRGASRAHTHGADADEAAGAAGPASGAAPRAAAGKPNRILFVEGLPEATTSAMLGLLFKQFPGFVEVRMVEAKPGIAFVEFESELQSGVALSGLAGFQITPTHTMQVTFAKQ